MTVPSAIPRAADADNQDQSVGTSSRDRMLAALSCQPIDHPPCCFMQFSALESRCRDQFAMVDQLLAWGLAATVQMPPWLLTVGGDSADLRGLPVEFHPEVWVSEARQPEPGNGYATLTKAYHTPTGVLSVEVRQTDDWPYGNHVPFLDDFIIPRARKPLLTSAAGLEPLRYLLMPPSAEVIRQFRADAHAAKEFARDRGVLLSGGTGAGADLAAWLCGLQELIYLTADDPVFVEALMAQLSAWIQSRMEPVLATGIDLWVRRAWYEGTDFWSPRLYRRFILPHLKQEVALAHRHGAKFGYLMTRGAMPLLDMILEAGIDVLIGVDPLRGGADLVAMRAKAAGRLCLWGGVNAALTVERGTAAEVRTAVHTALDALAPAHGFVLAPVDEVDDPSEHTWNNVHAFMAAWREWIALHSA
jgi:uroporphyrinogen-III decarboxylase